LKSESRWIKSPSSCVIDPSAFLKESLFYLFLSLVEDTL
jgi:hypothetical protein